MTCPTCQSDNIEQTGKFDLTLIEPWEARHDFECCECGTLFQIHYAAEKAVVVELPGDNDDAA